MVLLSLRACGVALRSGVVYRVRPAKGISQIFSDLQRRMLGSTSLCGAIAQLGERLHGMQEVGGSIPPGSTIQCLRCGIRRRVTQRSCCNHSANWDCRRRRRGGRIQHVHHSGRVCEEEVVNERPIPKHGLGSNSGTVGQQVIQLELGTVLLALA